jgi:tetratricopeptide (TPR) repeat protein
VVFRDTAPRAIYYRVAEFQIAARGYERQNRLREASHEYLQLAHLTPLPQIQTEAWLAAAQLLTRAGDTQEARRWLDAAARTAGTDAATLISIGDAWQALGDAGNALVAYRKAQALRPGGQLGKHLQQRFARLAAPP